MGDESNISHYADESNSKRDDVQMKCNKGETGNICTESVKNAKSHEMKHSRHVSSRRRRGGLAVEEKKQPQERKHHQR